MRVPISSFSQQRLWLRSLKTVMHMPRLCTTGSKSSITLLRIQLICLFKLTMVCNSLKQLKVFLNMPKRTYCSMKKKTGMKNYTDGEMLSEFMKTNNLKNPITSVSWKESSNASVICLTGKTCPILWSRCGTSMLLYKMVSKRNLSNNNSKKLHLQLHTVAGI